VVVETIGFSGDSWLDSRGFHHSTSLKVTERLRRVGDDIIYNVTVEVRSECLSSISPRLQKITSPK
jgi:hypothetical protein